MKNPIDLIARNQSGAAGAEMALITPLLVVLMFGSFELGYYFYNEHVLVKSVRDAARFGGRQLSLFAPATCTSGPVTGATATAIDNVARYGKTTTTIADKPKIYTWTTAVTVTMSCPAIGSYAGIYRGKSNVPVITVTASNVTYPSLFQVLGFTSSNLKLNASSQSAVMGV
ncbi:MAG: TadE/TadG family type IV pilus assembly protein [Pseudomonadota bacterium]